MKHFLKTKIYQQKYLINAILLILFFGINLKEGKGQQPCGSGFTFNTFRININGCEYDYAFCYKCQPIALYPYQIVDFGKITPVDINCSQSLSDQEVLEQLRIEILKFSYLSQLCEIRPCELTPKSKMQFNTYACWQKKWFFPTNNPLDDYWSYVACSDDAICETVYEVCKDFDIDNDGIPDPNGPTIVWDVVSKQWKNLIPPSCPPAIGGNIPLPRKSAVSSGCLKLNTPCDQP